MSNPSNTSKDQIITLRLGDCVELFSTLKENSVGGIITDPPYGISFMGKKWDDFSGTSNDPDVDSIQLFHEFWLEQAYRVLKPGGVIKAFSATRTYHRLLAAMENVGFRDLRVESWTYASGFPKSLNISKALDKLAGKEPMVVGSRKGKGGENLNKLSRPDGSDDTDAKGCGAYGTGAKQVTVDIPVTVPVSDLAIKYSGFGTALKPAFEPICCGIKPS